MVKKKILEIFSINVLPLYGMAVSFKDPIDAILFIKKQPETGRSSKSSLVRIEIQVRYKDGTRVEGQFRNKFTATEFLDNRARGIL